MQQYCANCDGTVVNKSHTGKEYLYCGSCKCWWSEKSLILATSYKRPHSQYNAISLTYEPNKTQHADLLLRLGTWATRCDTYYYELDHSAGTEPNTVASIRALLKQWHKDVQNLKSEGQIYLPYDFSDQHSGWLQVKFYNSDKIGVSDGYCSLEGYAFYPSAYKECIDRITDYEVYEGCEEKILTSKKIVDDIETSIDDLYKL
ncbi:hypothetical protein MNBD_GAMMA10-1651 [hydrothermal vent metagenome]|uniref:Uncharacterized protein n=1 Tax=hydrothermal vent metagenome TaxID=652676 RepID=A0A3B0XRS9_9ZZZZ